MSTRWWLSSSGQQFLVCVPALPTEGKCSLLGRTGLRVGQLWNEAAAIVCLHAATLLQFPARFGAGEETPGDLPVLCSGFFPCTALESVQANGATHQFPSPLNELLQRVFARLSAQSFSLLWLPGCPNPFSCKPTIVIFISSTHRALRDFCKDLCSHQPALSTRKSGTSKKLLRCPSSLLPSE